MRSILGSVAGVLLLGAATLASAQSMETGTVVRIDPQSKVVILDDGRMYRVTPNTVLVVDSQPAQFTALTPGQRVMIQSGEVVALRNGQYVAVNGTPAVVTPGPAVVTPAPAPVIADITAPAGTWHWVRMMLPPPGTLNDAAEVATVPSVDRPPMPLPSRRPTVSSPELVTARSGKPSSFTSAAIVATRVP